LETLKKREFSERISFLKLSRCSISMAFWMAIIDVILLELIWIGSTLILIKSSIQPFSLQNNCFESSKMKKKCFFTVIFMDIRGKRIFSCMDVLERISTKKNKFSLYSWETIAMSSRSRIALFKSKKTEKDQLE